MALSMTGREEALTTNQIPGRTALTAAGVCGATAKYVYLP